MKIVHKKSRGLVAGGFALAVGSRVKFNLVSYYKKSKFKLSIGSLFFNETEHGCIR